MNRLVIIDGHAILYRAYHALPTSLTTSKGQMVNAVYGFTSMLLRVVAELKPTHLIVAFDTPEPTFRNKLYEDYQIQRPKADDDFISQIGMVKKLVTEMGIVRYEKPGFEADDVIGTLAFQASSHTNKEQQFEVIIVSGDRDMLQLVNDRVKIYMPVKGLSESKLYGTIEVEEKYSITPAQIVDYKALVGDPSDNYPGVAGIGPKTASSLISRYKSFEKLYAHLDEIESVKVKTALKANEKLAKVSRKLARILTDVPLKINWEQCILRNFDREDVHLLFDELGFRSLIARLASKNKEQRTKKSKLAPDKNDIQIKLF
ncbi:hypothetical protein A3D03_03875 [Candidatus Gottesmanbacteria bacterium RIFCSPHIGHO2_02_FULL_40_13]|uniref:5'-3' exonuclease domain-containing protein n=1 Tax=Candidatus Gottesmanbacteria bacterium RIFCSPHIGHO2_02_FULL_40_13 TaxID=1798384 RepID=A0A1F6A5Y3_9BACT|nr:MAG: hypothetical protein A3D03_03875 [Candidatus Gottesmanbacteria bacterium RIFCSPHIGHO2_02_FULL_40_13]